MRKYILLLIVLLIATTIQAETITVEIQTDKTTYFIGQTVSWTIYAWAEVGTNRGVSLVSLDLDDDSGDPLNPALMSGSDFQDTEFGTAQNFQFSTSGTQSPTPPKLQDVGTFQFNFAKMFDIGSDGLPHVLCKGTYDVTTVGTHNLNVIIDAAEYWPDTTNNTVSFETPIDNDTTFDVIPEPTFCGDTGTVYLQGDINDNCYIDLVDFSIMSSEWLVNPCTGPLWCNGADIDHANGVNLDDLMYIVTEWLACTDPTDSNCDIYWK